MKRQVVRLWTCLLFLAFLFSVSLRAEDTFEVEEISSETRTKDRLAFTVKFSTQTGRAQLTPEARAKFSFEINYEYNGKSTPVTIQDSATPQETGQKLFYVTSGTSIDTIQGTYQVEIKKDSRYVGTNTPKNLSEIGAIRILVKYDSNSIDGATEVAFEENKDVKYNLGNNAYVTNLILAPEYKQVLLKAPGSRDQFLHFNHKAPGKIEQKKNTDLISSQKMDLVVLKLEGVDNQTDYTTDFSVPGDTPGKSFPISSRALDLLDPTTRVKRTKADENQIWATVLESEMQAVQSTECYFVFPKKEDIVHGNQYECVRCNFNNSALNSTDKVYLLNSSSFAGKENVVNKVGEDKSQDLSGGHMVEDIENDEFYAVLPLFSDGTMIHYAAHQVPKASDFSKVMCKIISPKADYTALEFLNGGSHDNTEKGDPRCFIVSAAYGSSFEPQVDIFRWLRDRFILKTSWGEKLMDFYYENSEPVANFIAGSEVLKFSVRTLLWPFALGLHLLKFLLDTPFFLSLLGVFFVSLFLLKTVFVRKT